MKLYKTQQAFHKNQTRNVHNFSLRSRKCKYILSSVS